MADPVQTLRAEFAALKNQAPADALLMVRLGDYLEFFFEDADAASAVLGEPVIPRVGDLRMCGVHRRRADEIVSKLTAAGHVVALCDVLNDPLQTGEKAIRGVVAVYPAVMAIKKAA